MKGKSGQDSFGNKSKVRRGPERKGEKVITPSWQKSQPFQLVTQITQSCLLYQKNDSVFLVCFLWCLFWSFFPSPYRKWHRDLTQKNCLESLIHLLRTRTQLGVSLQSHRLLTFYFYMMLFASLSHFLSFFFMKLNGCFSITLISLCMECWEVIIN